MRRSFIISVSVPGWTWLNAPSMSCVRIAGRSGLGPPGCMVVLSAFVAGVIVRRRASMAEFSD